MFEKNDPVLIKAGKHAGLTGVIGFKIKDYALDVQLYIVDTGDALVECYENQLEVLGENLGD